MVIFLDFDGVLHPEPVYQEEHLWEQVPRLESVLRDFSSVEIVISSSWRHERSLDELRSIFSRDVQARIIDVTPHWKDPECESLFEVIGPYERHVEIEAWRRNARRIHEPWVAIDDRPWWFKPFTENLVICQTHLGMDDAAETLLRKKLSEQ